jgi:hypothetical protein
VKSIVLASILLLNACLLADTNISLDIDANKNFPALRGELQEFYVLNEENMVHATASWKQYYNQSAYTSSFGVGARHEFTDLILGLNLFFDVSEHSGYFAPQNSIGLEVINEFIDLRANYYQPWKKQKINKRYEINYFNSMDFHLIIKLFKPVSVDLNTSYDFNNQRHGMKVELSYDMNQWLNIGVHVGSDFDKSKNVGIRFTFGLYAIHKEMFSSVSRNYHINYIKTKRPALKPLSPVLPPLPKPPSEPVQPYEGPPPFDPVEAPKPPQAPFFFWRLLGY